MPRNGGPAVNLLLGNHVRESNSLSAGELHYYATFWNHIKKSNQRAPKEMKGFFLDLAKEIRSRFEAVRSGGKVFWVGPEVTQRRLEGLRLVGVDL